MRKNQRCVECVNDKTIKHISFDDKGVCNFCNTYKRQCSDFHDYSKLEKIFLDKIHNRGKHKYDVALGFSGGKDSTYVLYQLTKVYNLHVKAYTLNNGFLSDEAKNKIDRITKELDVEHEYILCDVFLLKEMYHYIVKKYLSPCIACSFLGYAVMINYATKIDAAVGIHGRSIPQMLRNYADDVDDYFKPFVDTAFGDNDIDVFKVVLDKIEQLVDKNLADKIKSELLVDSLREGFRPFLGYFFYHPYNQKSIISFLENNTSWRVESEEEHFDCQIHNGALYLKNMVARRSHLMPEYSVMVREGTMSREEALAKLKYKSDLERSKKELKMLCKYADIHYSTLMFKAKIYSKRWW